MCEPFRMVGTSIALLVSIARTGKEWYSLRWLVMSGLCFHRENSSLTLRGQTVERKGSSMRHCRVSERRKTQAYNIF